MEQPSLGCGHGDTHRFRGLPYRAFLQQLNLHYRSERGSQALDRFPQLAFFFPLRVPPFRIRLMIGYFAAQAIRAEIIVIVRGNLARSSFLAEIHQRRVDGDAREPGSETGSAIKLPYVKERAQEGVLNCVLGVLNGSGDSVCGTKQLLPVSLRKCVEGRGIPSLGCFHQALIAQSVNIVRWRGVRFR